VAGVLWFSEVNGSDSGDGDGTSLVHGPVTLKRGKLRTGRPAMNCASSRGCSSRRVFAEMSLAVTMGCLALNGPSRAAPVAVRVIKIRATRAGFQSGAPPGGCHHSGAPLARAMLWASHGPATGPQGGAKRPVIGENSIRRLGDPRMARRRGRSGWGRNAGVADRRNHRERFSTVSADRRILRRYREAGRSTHLSGRSWSRKDSFGTAFATPWSKWRTFS